MYYQYLLPHSEHLTETIPEAHDIATWEHPRPAFPAIDSKKMTKSIGMNHPM